MVPKGNCGSCSRAPIISPMRIALFADVHANREALLACLAQARQAGADRQVFLGDLVGYGADPGWVVDTVAEACNHGAIAILGNHDEAVEKSTRDMNPAAASAMQFTRAALSRAQGEFLKALPLTVADEDRLYTHASPRTPASWPYVRDAEDAAAALAATDARIAFCGHLHLPALFGVTATGKLASFTPASDTAIPLLKPRRWLARLGSVGQPRDGDPAAAWALLDTQKNEIRYMRAPYDVEAAMAKIRAAGLPESLALRLARGM